MITKHPLIFSVAVNPAWQHQSSVTSHLVVSPVGGGRVEIEREEGTHRSLSFTLSLVDIRES